MAAFLAPEFKSVLQGEESSETGQQEPEGSEISFYLSPPFLQTEALE